MKKLLGVVTAAAMGLGMATSAQAVMFTGSPSPSLSPTFGTLVNFDDQPSGTAIGAADYLGLGVASVTETEGVGTFARYAGSQSAPNYIGTGVGGERGTDANLGWDGTILFQFTGLASNVGIGVADSRGGPETISAYDSAMTLLESYLVPTGANVYVGISRATADIKYFTVTGDFFAIDDLQHDASSVPAPAGLLLLGTGLLGFYGSRRFRKC